jgi:hypothetical protein
MEPGPAEAISHADQLHETLSADNTTYSAIGELGELMLLLTPCGRSSALAEHALPPIWSAT